MLDVYTHGNQGNRQPTAACEGTFPRSSARPLATLQLHGRRPPLFPDWTGGGHDISAVVNPRATATAEEKSGLGPGTSNAPPRRITLRVRATRAPMRGEQESLEILSPRNLPFAATVAAIIS